MDIFLFVNALLIVVLCFTLKFTKRYKSYFVLIIIGLMVFLNLSILLIHDQLKNFDTWIYEMVTSNMSYHMTIFMKYITNLGSFYALVLITVIVYILTWNNNKNAIVYGRVISINLVTVWLMNNGLKLIFQRERPDILRLVEESSLSFPSGHAMVSMCFYGFLAYLILRNSNNKLIRIVSVWMIGFIIVMIGISRIYLGVHYASDVLAGFAFGWVWMFLMIIAMEQFYKRRIEKYFKKLIKI
ncbi:MAG: phosphatase PAP2 family protein [Clostridia bacterium]|nr:phosphatase PAP2 family protein [Clostridia bacterium]